MKRVVSALIGAVGAIACLSYYIAAYHILPYSSIRPHRLTRSEITQIFPGKLDPGVVGLKFAQLNVIVEDSITLKGWFIHARNDSALGTLVLLHGIANCKESLLGFADTLSRLGYNCILYDSRAHGESGGINCTFGYYEKRDVSAYIDEALKQFQNLGPIGIYGNSLGAAVAIQAMATDSRIKCGIVESPFATLREVVYDYWNRMSGLPLHFIPNKALEGSERIAHFVVDDVSPEASAKEIFCPVLVVHGDQDIHIASEYGRRVFNNLRSPEKKWYLIQGGDHYSLSKVGGAAYSQTLTTFLQAHLKE